MQSEATILRGNLRIRLPKLFSSGSLLPKNAQNFAGKYSRTHCEGEISDELLPVLENNINKPERIAIIQSSPFGIRKQSENETLGPK